MTRLLVTMTAAIVLLSLAVAWLIFKDDPWKDRARAGETQAGLNAESGAIADKTGQTTTRIILQSETMAHAVQSAPGGDAPIPPAVRDGWSAAIDGMRERPPAGDADHPREPAR